MERSGGVRVRNEEEFRRKKYEIMEKCYECYAEHGLGGIGIKGLAEACGCTSASLYTYFTDLDDLILQSTAYCMSKVEEEFMSKAPADINDVWRFIDEIPYWTAKKHGKKYRLMYQVYTHPKYFSHGKDFFEGVDRRYSEYAAELESKIGISKDILTPLIFILIRASVHYALFEAEFYLQAQLRVLKQGISMYLSRKDSLLTEEKPL